MTTYVYYKNSKEPSVYDDVIRTIIVGINLPRQTMYIRYRNEKGEIFEEGIDLKNIETISNWSL